MLLRPRDPTAKPALAVTLALLTLWVGPALRAQTPAASTALIGEWIFVMEGDAQPQRVALAIERDSLRGRVYGVAFSIAPTGDKMTFAVGDYRWRGQVAGDAIRGWLGIGNDSTSWE